MLIFMLNVFHISVISFQPFLLFGNIVARIIKCAFIYSFTLTIISNIPIKYSFVFKLHAMRRTNIVNVLLEYKISTILYSKVYTDHHYLL